MEAVAALAPSPLSTPSPEGLGLPPMATASAYEVQQQCRPRRLLPRAFRRRPRRNGSGCT
eukprot:8076573-Alexandrium_andersonii.AAC.1